MGPNEKKLHEVLKRHFDAGMQNIHFDWADGASERSREERCAAVVSALEEVDRWNSLSVEEQMRIQIRQVYEELDQIKGLCRFNVRDWDKPVEDARKKLSKIFGIVDMAMLTLGNWIDPKEKAAIRQRGMNGGLPPIDESLHTDQLIAELQKPALQLDSTDRG